MQHGISTETVRRNRSRWLTASWIGLLLLGGSDLFGAINDLLADAHTAHRPTTPSPSVGGTSWATVRHQPRTFGTHDTAAGYRSLTAYDKP